MTTAVFKGDNQHRVDTHMYMHTYSAISCPVCTRDTSSHTQRLRATCRSAQSTRVDSVIALRGSSTTTRCCRYLSRFDVFLAPHVRSIVAARRCPRLDCYSLRKLNTLSPHPAFSGGEVAKGLSWSVCGAARRVLHPMRFRWALSHRGL